MSEANSPATPAQKTETGLSVSEAVEIIALIAGPEQQALLPGPTGSDILPEANEPVLAAPPAAAALNTAPDAPPPVPEGPGPATPDAVAAMGPVPVPEVFGAPGDENAPFESRPLSAASVVPVMDFGGRVHREPAVVPSQPETTDAPPATPPNPPAASADAPASSAGEVASQESQPSPSAALAPNSWTAELPHEPVRVPADARQLSFFEEPAAWAPEPVVPAPEPPASVNESPAAVDESPASVNEPQVTTASSTLSPIELPTVSLSPVEAPAQTAQPALEHEEPHPHVQVNEPSSPVPAPVSNSLETTGAAASEPVTPVTEPFVAPTPSVEAPALVSQPWSPPTPQPAPPLSSDDSVASPTEPAESHTEPQPAVPSTVHDTVPQSADVPAPAQNPPREPEPVSTEEVPPEILRTPPVAIQLPELSAAGVAAPAVAVADPPNGPTTAAPASHGQRSHSGTLPLASLTLASGRTYSEPIADVALASPQAPETPTEGVPAPKSAEAEKRPADVNAEGTAVPPAVIPPVDAHSPPIPPRPNSDSNGPSQRLSGMQWTVMGFAVGVVCGALLLMRYQMAAPASGESAVASVPAATPQLRTSAPVAAPSRAPKKSHSAPVRAAAPATPAVPDHEAKKLQAEVERLRQEVERRRLQAELDSLRRELLNAPFEEPEPFTVPEPQPKPAAPRPSVPAPAPAAESSPGRGTLEAWNRMNDIIAREETLRSVPAGGVTANNAGSFLDRRIAAGLYAAEALDGLDTSGVDPEVTGFIARLSAWYEQGAAISRQGKELLEEENIETRRGPAGVQWQNAYKKHEQSVQELNAAGARVREAMQAKYGLNFPPLR